MKQGHVRTIWISDIHLGTPACKAEALRSFLKSYTCDKLYLVGDVIDGWALKNRWYWPVTHNQVLRTVLGKAEKENTEVVYITGNHDEFLRDYTDDNDLSFGSIRITDEDTHKTVDGRNLWIVHGDRYDAVLKHYKTVEKLGDIGYGIIMWLNRRYDVFRRKNGFPKFSLIQYMKSKIKIVSEFTEKFERAVSHETKKRKFDGVVCGHIHCKQHHKKYGVEYWNDGDWVENCTAVIEHIDGKMEVVEWVEDYLDDKGKPVFILKSLRP